MGSPLFVVPIFLSVRDRRTRFHRRRT